MTEASAPTKLTFGAALKEVGWLPILLMSLGGLSIIDILETAVFGELNLFTPFQIVLDGYQRLSALIGAIVERPLAPLLAWLGGVLNFDIVLQPHWRSLFLLQTIAVSSIIRPLWSPGQTLKAILAGGVMCLGCLVASLIVGAAPPTTSPWIQGVIAASMVLTLWFTFGLVASFESQDPGDRLDVKNGVLVASVTAALTFVAAVILAFTPVGAGAAVSAFGLFIAVFGMLFLIGAFIGPDADTDTFRIGLGVLGGFVAAALVLIADAVIKAVS